MYAWPLRGRAAEDCRTASLLSMPPLPTLFLWNQQIDVAKFSWTTSSFGGSKGDRQNTAFFSSTVYGQTYGSAIAVTVYYYGGSIMEEADNLFNSALLWDSYRGPLQYNFKKGKYVYDFHRVAIHEFGH